MTHVNSGAIFSIAFRDRMRACLALFGLGSRSRGRFWCFPYRRCIGPNRLCVHGLASNARFCGTPVAFAGLSGLTSSLGLDWTPCESDCFP